MIPRIRARQLTAKPLILFACLLLGFDPARAQVTDLSVTESGENAILIWGTGTAPYRVYRSTSPDFYSGNRVVADAVTTSSTTDTTVLRPGNHSFYYSVFVDGENDPPGFDANPPPPPAPIITAINPGSGKPGDTVILSGSGFIGDGSRMTVTFHHAIADIQNASETELTVIVPAGALTGDVLVCIASDICSSPFPFFVTYGPTFQEISSIAFERGTGSLWVADRPAGAGRVYEITAAGEVQRGSLARPILGHPSPANGNGRIYYGRSDISSFNTGTIEYIDSATNAELFFDNAGDAVNADPVWCRGIAANDLEPDVVYYLDGNDNDFGGANDGQNVRRIVRNAPVHDISYGDQPFVFNDPAGARFDSAGNLYLTSTTAIYKILPQEAGVELVASGFTAAAGIDLIKDGNDTLLAVADEATGTVWLVNSGTGEKVQVRSGLSGPVGVAFTDEPAAGMTGLYVAEPTRILRLPDPRLSFVVENDQKVLLSKKWSSDDYPSTDQTTERQIKVRVKLTPVLNPTGRNAYFQLSDPKDPSRYIDGAFEGDNLDSPPAGVTPQAPFDDNRVAMATLTVDHQYSGNNYRVEAGLAAGASFRVLAISPVYTSWRRAYIEHDRMWRQGAWVIADSGAAEEDPTKVVVSDKSIFIVGEPVHILSGESAATASGEFRIIAAISDSENFVQVDRPLEHTYRSAVAAPPDDDSPYSFLARTAPGALGVAPSTANLAVAFDDTFTEWHVLPLEGFLPYWRPSGSITQEAYEWLQERSPRFFNMRLAPDPVYTNTVQLVSADVPPPVAPYNGASGGSNWSWIFEDMILQLYPSAIENARASVTAHEFAHQFNVNQLALDQGHDSLDAWTPTGKCLMNQSRDRTLGVVKMHKPLGASTNDLMCIRTHVDTLESSICSHQ